MPTLADLRSGVLAGVRRLDLENAGLTEVPREVLALADSLEVLNLSGNRLTTLPPDLARLKRLRVLFCSDNPFTAIPEGVGDCAALELVGFRACAIERVDASALPPRLRWLVLTDNRVATLPAALGERPQLQKLMLAGNRLRALPESIAACGRLELIRLAANDFAALPAWLLQLPRLAWLAYAGNPFSDPLEAQAVARHPLASVDWSSLALQQTLGSGASGVIHRVARRAADGTESAAALKLFKGAVTSDGLPRSELAACVAAGSHRGLIGVQARLAGHPAATPGLLMPLIAPQFRALAGPPSLDSCSRDVYADDARFAPAQRLGIAGAVASAAAHLHARGILHGDLYAHNTLWDGGEQALIGDFGAASFFAPDDSPRSRALQGIEARAFGCLLEELLQHGDDESAARGALAQLRDDCLQERVAQRPRLAEVEARLRELG